MKTLPQKVLSTGDTRTNVYGTRYLSLVLCLFFNACSLLKASPAPSSGFLPLEEHLQERRERAPFNASYIPNRELLDTLKKKYNHFCITPVSVGPLRAYLRREEFSEESAAERLEDATELGNYLRERFRRAFEEKKLPVSLEPKERCLVWEIAIVELRPTIVTVNVAAAAAGAFVPGAGLASRLGTGSIAIEGVVRDSSSGEVLAVFKDREKDKNALFTVRDFQLYSHARTSLDEWAEQFAELSATTGEVTVSDSLPVTLSPF